MHESIKRIFDGILLFRKFKRPAMVKEFERVRDHPDPRAVLFTCMDSRLQPSEFMQARIGDLFVVRNSANMVPLARNFGGTASEVSVTTEPAALELAIKRGNVCQVLVCGHSDCKAINTLYQLYNGRAFDPESPMDHWLRHNGHLSIQKLEKLIKNEKSSKKLEFASENGLMKFKAKIDPENKYGVEDKLSQINTLQQLTNIASHEFLREHIEKRLVGLQAFWLDIFTGELYFFSRRQESFVPIDEENSASLLKEALCSVDD
ncbi:Carbonic anhydrase [Meloidogyne graminicola]|uniref:Carbonic anhydrase n=1 Tax=Meloidogyne graminicola TaxID=189291 RepID=A0A8T0A258_9BILA|nr:Carbonic anhydrase [Meloidogyne graminicola]